MRLFFVRDEKSEYLCVIFILPNAYNVINGRDGYEREHCANMFVAHLEALQGETMNKQRKACDRSGLHTIH